MSDATTSAALSAAREAKARADKATPGPWIVSAAGLMHPAWTEYPEGKWREQARERGGHGVLCWAADEDTLNKERDVEFRRGGNDEAFIAWCREGVPALAQHIEALAAANAKLERINELQKLAVDRWVPCPGHRDKTERGICYVCENEMLKRANAALEAHLAETDEVINILYTKEHTLDTYRFNQASENAMARHRARRASAPGEKDKSGG